MKLLMVNLPFSGHTNPTLELASQLVTAGHEVGYIHDEAWRSKIEKTGAAFIPYDPAPSSSRWLGKEISAWSRAYHTALRVGPDYQALIYEMLFLQGKQLADQLGIPAFRIFSTFALNEQVLKDFASSGGWYMTKIFDFPWACRFIGKRLMKHQLIANPDIVTELCQNQPLHNFVYTTRQFQPYESAFSSRDFDFVGASVSTTTMQDTAFKWPKQEGKLIYISLGTLLNTTKVGQRFFRRCIDALAHSPHTVIMSIGEGQLPETFGSVPPHVHLYERVPQLEVLARADLFITHGGMNSVNEAIHFGVPMVVVPIGNDQPTVARQVVTCELGQSLNIHQATVSDIQAAIQTLLDDDHYRQQGRVFAQTSHQSGGNRAIVRQIERILSQS